MDDFPAQVTKINVIENCWSYLKRQVYSKPFPKTTEELDRKIMNKWNLIEPEYIRKLYMSIKNRLRLIIMNKGSPIKY